MEPALLRSGPDGKAQCVPLSPRSELEQSSTGAVVEGKGAADVRTGRPVAIAQVQAKPDRDPRQVIVAHVRRLKALRCTGIAKLEAEGVWHVPKDLAFDSQYKRAVKDNDSDIHCYLQSEDSTRQATSVLTLSAAQNRNVQSG